MLKIASIALTAVVGMGGIAAAIPAEAHPYITVGVGLPRVVVEPFAYAPAYYPPFVWGYGYGPGGYWRRDYDRDRYEHFHHRWDRDQRHWERR